jgi:hypothetical protein
MAVHKTTIEHVEGGRWPFAWEDFGLDSLTGHYVTRFECNGAEIVSRWHGPEANGRMAADRNLLAAYGWRLDSVDWRRAT